VYERVNMAPEMGIVRDFLSGDEAKEVIRLAEEKGFVPAHTGSSTQGEMYDGMAAGNPFEVMQIKESSNRTGTVCLLEPPDASLVEIIMRRVAYLAECHFEQVECLSVVKYLPGQFFKQHHDGAFRPKTVFIYLNTIPSGDGGETFFPFMGFKFKPVEGVAAMWDNISDGKADTRMIHEGLPTTGQMTKYGINCFVNEKQVQKRLTSIVPSKTHKTVES